MFRLLENLHITYTLQTSYITYNLAFRRKISVVSGMSATGKTEILRLISANKKEIIGIKEVLSKKDFQGFVLTFDVFRSIKKAISKVIMEFPEKHRDKNKQYRERIREIVEDYDNKIIFCDEFMWVMRTVEFSIFCKYVFSYIVLITREPMPMLPYGFTEIYEMVSDGKLNTLQGKFQQENYLDLPEGREEDLYVVEDSKSGFQFYSSVFKRSTVVSADGKDNILGVLKTNYQQYGRIIIIADGAAFGSCIEVIEEWKKNSSVEVFLFLPESFEYLLLISGLFSEDEIRMENTLAFFSNERFYTAIIAKCTKNLENMYQKKKLNNCYCEPCFSLPKCTKGICNLRKVRDKKGVVLGKYLSNPEPLNRS